MKNICGFFILNSNPSFMNLLLELMLNKLIVGYYISLDFNNISMDYKMFVKRMFLNLFLDLGLNIV